MISTNIKQENLISNFSTYRPFQACTVQPIFEIFNGNNNAKKKTCNHLKKDILGCCYAITILWRLIKYYSTQGGKGIVTNRFQHALI